MQKGQGLHEIKRRLPVSSSTLEEARWGKKKGGKKLRQITYYLIRGAQSLAESDETRVSMPYGTKTQSKTTFGKKGEKKKTRGNFWDQTYSKHGVEREDIECQWNSRRILMNRRERRIIKKKKKRR